MPRPSEYWIRYDDGTMEYFKAKPPNPSLWVTLKLWAIERLNA